MDKISCNVICDMLELYVDDVVSEDTRIVIQDHLSECAECKNKYEQIKRNIVIPADTNTKLLDNIKKKIKRKKIMVSAVSIIFSIMLMFLFIVFYRIPLEYNAPISLVLEKERNNIDITLRNGAAGAYIASGVINDSGDYAYYIYAYDTLKTRWFSKKDDNLNSGGVSLPMVDEVTCVDKDGNITKRKTRYVAIYYCISSFTRSGKGDVKSEAKLLLWEDKSTVK
jgi:hypothetical protein